MTLEETLKILDKLAAGEHPETGKVLPDDSVCNSRSVIRALQMAIDLIKAKDNHSINSRQFSAKKSTVTNHQKNETLEIESINIDEYLTDEKLFEYLQTFKEVGFNPTVARIGKCLIGTQAKSIYSHVKDFEFYGILEDATTYSTIKPIISTFFDRHEAKINEEYLNIDKPWEEIDYFEQADFNQLTEFTIAQLTETIGDLPLKRNVSNMSSEAMVVARNIFPRAYEPWEQQENSMLLRTLRYTNDLELLSTIFKRGHGAVRSQGQRLLYQIAQSALGSK